MKISVEQLCRIMEREGLVIVERYRLLTALKEYNYYNVEDDGWFSREILSGDKTILDESDDIELLKNLKILAKTGYVSRKIKSGELSDPESVMLR